MRTLPMRRSRERKGNAAFAAVSIVTLLGFAALTVDIGHARRTRAQIQNAADAAAHAALAELDGTADGLDAAADAAIAVAALNEADGTPVVLDADDLVFGAWDDGDFEPSSDPELVNAVIVTYQQDVTTVFAPVSLGISALSAAASAMAVVPAATPAVAVSCYLPIAVPRCAVAGEGIFDFQASNNNTDTAGWAVLPGDDGGTPNADFLKEQLAGQSCQGAEIGESVAAMNGNASSATAAAIRRLNYGGQGGGPFQHGGLVYEPPDAWPVDEWPVQPGSGEKMTGSGVSSDVFGQYGISGPVLMVSLDEDGDGEDDFCADADGDGVPDDPPNWNGDLVLEGFAFGMIYDGKAAGGGQGASSPVLRVRINTEYDFDDYATDGGGDSDYGLVFQEPPRVMPAP